MTKYGSQFSGTDPLKKADGQTHNAGVRAYKNQFALATDGGTSEPIKIAELGPGVTWENLLIDTDANLSGINFTVGTSDTPAKYGASTAGPNATQKTIYPPLTIKMTATTTKEEVFLFPSGNMPSSGTLHTRVHCSGR